MNLLKWVGQLNLLYVTRRPGSFFSLLRSNRLVFASIYLCKAASDAKICSSLHDFPKTSRSWWRAKNIMTVTHTNWLLLLGNSWSSIQLKAKSWFCQPSKVNNLAKLAFCNTWSGPSSIQLKWIGAKFHMTWDMSARFWGLFDFFFKRGHWRGRLLRNNDCCSYYQPISSTATMGLALAIFWERDSWSEFQTVNDGWFWEISLPEFLTSWGFWQALFVQPQPRIGFSRKLAPVSAAD